MDERRPRVDQHEAVDPALRASYEQSLKYTGHGAARSFFHMRLRFRDLLPAALITTQRTWFIWEWTWFILEQIRNSERTVMRTPYSVSSCNPLQSLFPCYPEPPSVSPFLPPERFHSKLPCMIVSSKTSPRQSLLLLKHSPVLDVPPHKVFPSCNNMFPSLRHPQKQEVGFDLALHFVIDISLCFCYQFWLL